MFHAPRGFFDCLQQRISAGNKKKRLPNSMSRFVRRDVLPLGMFTKYTWNIKITLHVKHIFCGDYIIIVVCQGLYPRTLTELLAIKLSTKVFTNISLYTNCEEMSKESQKCNMLQMCVLVLLILMTKVTTCAYDTAVITVSDFYLYCILIWCGKVKN